MGARDRRTTDDKTQAGTEATGEVGEAAGMDRRGAGIVGPMKKQTYTTLPSRFTSSSSGT